MIGLFNHEFGVLVDLADEGLTFDDLQLLDTKRVSFQGFAGFKALICTKGIDSPPDAILSKVIVGELSALSKQRSKKRTYSKCRETHVVCFFLLIKIGGIRWKCSIETGR